MAITSRSISFWSHLMHTEVSRPPEYASTTFSLAVADAGVADAFMGSSFPRCHMVACERASPTDIPVPRDVPAAHARRVAHSACVRKIRLRGGRSLDDISWTLLKALGLHANRDNELSSSGDCALASAGCVDGILAGHAGDLRHTLICHQSVCHVDYNLSIPVKSQSDSHERSL